MKLADIYAIGMISSVGFIVPSNCAAVRCGLNYFQKTRFMGRTGEWIVG